MGSLERSPEIPNYDVLIIGAGISGINAAYRVKTQLPGYSYAILEARGAIGGTWDFFKYPGIRSDSDLHTFGFPWRPWTHQQAIADGATIVKYIRETAASEGIDKKVEFHHKVVAGNWSTQEQAWTLQVDHDGEKKEYRARFVILSTGYYDYDEPLPTTIPGLKNFKGTVVHPQFWPEDLDYTDKKIVVIGSGATAVTLIPSLAEKASHVTMLQRSPSYLLSLPNKAGPLSKILPEWITSRLNRIRFLILPFLFFNFCRAYPNAARRVFRFATTKQLPKNIPHDPHFNPRYNPWEQRLCLCPNGDFYKTLREGKADIATDTIKSVYQNGVELESGQKIEADIIITATGLKIQIAGGTSVSVDGKPIIVPDKFMWKGVMMQDLPNMSFVIGYTNASWTLGADATAQLITRLMKTMENKEMTSAVPRLENSEKLKKMPVLNLNSTYVMRAMDRLPKVADTAPWKRRDNYFSDIYTAKFGDIQTGLEFTRKEERVKT